MNKPKLRLPSSTPSNESEMLPYAYYSSRITSEDIRTYDFFTYSIGGKHPDTNRPATLYDTNLKKESSIETPNRFYLDRIELIADVPLTDNNADEIIRQLLTGGVFTFKLGNQEKIVDVIEHIISPSQVWKSSQVVKSTFKVRPTSFLLLPEHYFSFTIEYGKNVPSDKVLRVVFGGRLVKPTSL